MNAIRLASLLLATPALAQIPDAEPLLGIGSPIAAGVADISARVAAADQGWVVDGSTAQGGRGLYGSFTDEGPGALLRSPQTIQGVSQGVLLKPSMGGGHIAYLSSAAPGQLPGFAWRDNQRIGVTLTPIGGSNELWSYFKETYAASDGSVVLEGATIHQDGLARTTWAHWPSQQVLIETRQSFPGISVEVQAVERFTRSANGAHWGAVARMQGAGQELAIVDGAPLLDRAGNPLLAWNPIVLGDPMAGPSISGNLELVHRCLVTDDGRVVLDLTIDGVRHLVRDGVPLRVLQQGESLDGIDRSGRVLTRGGAPGFTFELEGAPMSAGGTGTLDADGDGFADPGFSVGTSNVPASITGDGEVYSVAFIDEFANNFGDGVVRLVQGKPDQALCEGAPNSTGHPATLRLVGTDVAAFNRVTATVHQLPPRTFGIPIFSRSVDSVPGFNGTAGTLCLGGQIGRSPLLLFRSDEVGTVRFPVFLNVIPQPTGTVAASAGDTWHVQFWYRDTANPAGGGSNLSSATSLTLR